MNFDRRSRIVLSALLSPAICFLLAAQLVLTFAPLIEGRFGADARPHVEAAGTNVHHAHNAADCAACAARGLQAKANHAASPAIASLRAVFPGPSARVENLAFLKECKSKSRPRAPPRRLA
jgi:hypothetical protein